jgi:hypothetical protein
MLLALIFSVSLLARLWKLVLIPPVVNGDESGGLIHTLTIAMGKSDSLFQLTRDGSVSYVTYLEKSLMLRLVGRDGVLIAVRTTTALFSVGALVPFYLLASKRMSWTIPLSSTLLFSFSSWYVNFSRLSWIAMDSVFYAMWLFYFVERMTVSRGWLSGAGAGLSGALILYGYNGGKVFLVGAAAQPLYWVTHPPEKVGVREKAVRVLVVGVLAAGAYLPQIAVILEN